jgi:heme exporter protein CcmD
MFSLGPHAWFIWMSYAVTLAALGGLTAWIWLDGRAAKARLAALDQARGGAGRESPSREAAR